MNTKPYLSQGNYYFLIICFLLLISLSKTAAGQSVAQARKDFDQLNEAYHTGKLSAEKYLDSAGTLPNQYWSHGIYFKNQELTDLLSLYKEIAWSKKEYDEARVNYYVKFQNNARMLGQTGAAMYYADKTVQETKKSGRKYSLRVDDFKIQVFIEQELYDKVIAIYKNDQAYIKQLPAQLTNNKVRDVEGMTAISILSDVINSYIKLKDTAAVYQTKLLADQIGAAFKRKYPIHGQYMLGNDYYRLSRERTIALFKADQARVGMLLDSIQILTTTYKDQETGYIYWNLFQGKIDHYLAIKNPDSASFYIKKFESLPDFLQNKQAVVNEYKAKLLSLQGNFQGSNSLLNNALAGERKAKASLMTEMDNLLYAYTEAENTKIDLSEAEKAKQQRTLWLVVISFSAALIVLTIYLIMVYRSRKAKAQVEALNNAANMQIVAMEEAKHQAVKEEQQRLGQDLHDGLSSSIAGIRHQLETLAMDTDDIALKNKLGTLQTEVARAYEVARNKSHEWFNAADEQQEQSFEKRIKLLTDSALPDSRYNKDIHIDDSSLMRIDMDTRIALLRIIQEAITNIIKHARAKNVGILIYEEMDNLLLTISDDGKGLGEKKSGNGKSAIGLQSIRRRVQYLNGETKIDSSTNGTEITVSIPLVSS